MSARRVPSAHHGVLPHSSAEIEFERMSAYGTNRSAVDSRCRPMSAIPAHSSFPENGPRFGSLAEAMRWLSACLYRITTENGSCASAPSTIKNLQ